MSSNRGIAVLALAVGLLVSGCSGAVHADERDGAADPGAPVQIGVLLPLTGGSQASGVAMRAAAQLTADDINAAGGVLGRQVELVVRDDACDPQTAVMAANDLVAAGVVAMAGGYCSSALVPTVGIFEAAGVPLIVPAANSTDLLAEPAEGVFLLSPTVVSEAEVADRWMAQLGVRKAAFVTDGTSYSLTLAQAADAAAENSGGLTSAGLLTVTQGSSDSRAVAQQIIDSGADAVYFTGYEPDAVQLAEDLGALGYSGMYVGADGTVGDRLLETAPQALSGPVYATVPPVAEYGDARVQQWAARFTAKTGQPALPYTLQEADAVTLAVDAIRRAGSTDVASVREQIAATDGLDLLTGPCRFSGHVANGVAYTLLRATTEGTTVAGTLVPDES